MPSLFTPQANNSQPKADLLAIDPGYRYFGYSLFKGAAIEKAGLCVAEKAEDWERWTGQLCSGQLCSQHFGSIAEVAFESLTATEACGAADSIQSGQQGQRPRHRQ